MNEFNFSVYGNTDCWLGSGTSYFASGTNATPPYEERPADLLIVKEWKCPACETVNKYDATYCGELHKHAVGCGRPKDLK